MLLPRRRDQETGGRALKQQRVPRLRFSGGWTTRGEEYKAALSQSCAEYSYFTSTLQEAEELSHIRRAQQLVNFQACTRCVDLNAQVTRALKSGDRSAAEAAKAR